MYKMLNSGDSLAFFNLKTFPDFNDFVKSIPIVKMVRYMIMIKNA